MTTRTYQVISADGHLEIPPDAWLRHVPSAHRDRAPRLVQLPAGGEGWIVEGMPIVHNGQNIVGRPSVEGERPVVLERRRDAGRRHRRRRASASASRTRTGSTPRCSTRRCSSAGSSRTSPTSDAYLAMVRAYNTFLAEDYCSVAPDRLIGNAVIPTTGTRRRHRRAAARQEPRAPVDLPGRSSPAGGDAPDADDDGSGTPRSSSGMAITAHGGLGDRMNPLWSRRRPARFDLVMAIVSRTVPGPPTRHRVDGRRRRVRPDPGAADLPRRDERRLDAGGLLHDGRLVPALPRLVRRRARRCSRASTRAALPASGSSAIRWRSRCASSSRRSGLMWGSDFPHSVTSYPRDREVARHHLRRRARHSAPAGPGRQPVRVLRPRPRRRHSPRRRRHERDLGARQDRLCRCRRRRHVHRRGADRRVAHVAGEVADHAGQPRRRRAGRDGARGAAQRVDAHGHAPARRPLRPRNHRGHQRAGLAHGPARRAARHAGLRGHDPARRRQAGARRRRLGGASTRARRRGTHRRGRRARRPRRARAHAARPRGDARAVDGA